MRFCPNCGTEVDDNALFCPTCGQAIDQAAEVEMPPAPAWPDPEPAPVAPEPQPTRETASEAAWDPEPPVAAVPPVAAAPPVPPRERLAPDALVSERVAVPEPAGPVRRPAPAGPAAGVNLPVAVPSTLSAWLIGGGAAVGALGALIGLFDGFVNPIEFALLVVLAGVAATVFLAGTLPRIPQLRLVTLAVILVALGVALDRLGFGGSGIAELLMFLGTAAAAIGAILLELGRDQPVGGASTGR